MIASLAYFSVTPSIETDELEDLLSYLNQVQSIDLTIYKRPSLLRRTRVHMQQVGIEQYQVYLNHLKQQLSEVNQLLNTIFINVTCFFRDRPVWDHLETQVIPQIIASKALDEPIRIWSVGCASGEEVYSLAMLLAEALGLEQFQKRVQLYGTDIDQEALLQARRGCYSSVAAKDIPPYLLERYFERTTDGYQCRAELRQFITFHPHNLIQTSPFIHVDLITCRNALMYFTPEAQIRALKRFHFSLNKTGILVLGKVESLVTRPQTFFFTPLERQLRMYTKINHTSY